ncbi:MAG: hypothetical protein RIQ99_2111 [Pseudomonadota bacterium]|jgi:hypothetical protein
MPNRFQSQRPGSDPAQGGVADQPAGPQHFIPPSLRELRAQAVQRLQAGLFGIAAIVLIVGLANIINDRARQVDAVASPAEMAARPSPSAAAKTDPLADIGVVPATTPDHAPPPAVTPAVAPPPAAGPSRNH